MRKNVTNEAINYLNDLVMADEASAESLEKREPVYGWSPLGLLNVILARSNRRRVGVTHEPGKPARFEVLEGDKEMIDVDAATPVEVRDMHVTMEFPEAALQTIADRVASAVEKRNQVASCDQIDTEQKRHQYNVRSAKLLAGRKLAFLAQSQIDQATELNRKGYLHDSVLLNNRNGDGYWFVGKTTSLCDAEDPTAALLEQVQGLKDQLAAVARERNSLKASLTSRFGQVRDLQDELAAVNADRAGLQLSLRRLDDIAPRSMSSTLKLEQWPAMHLVCSLLAASLQFTPRSRLELNQMSAVKKLVELGYLEESDMTPKVPSVGRATTKALCGWLCL